MNKLQKYAYDWFAGSSAGFSGILDLYPNATSAYSLRRLRSTYSGPAIRVRRSSDNTEQDIAFTPSGDLDESALLSFVGAGNGFVTTWYDQGYNPDFEGENRIGYSQSFNESWWIKSGSSIVANSTNAPDSTLTADTLVESATNAEHYIIQSPLDSNVRPGSDIVISIFAKSNTRSWIRVRLTDGGSNAVQAWFNLSTGTVGSSQVASGTATVNSYSMTAAENGFYRCSLSVKMPSTSSGAYSAFYATATSDLNTTYLGDGTSSIYIWGAQINLNQLRTYKPTDVSGYAEVNMAQGTAVNQPRIVNTGVVEKQNSKPTIVFDGTNDGLLNGRIGNPRVNHSVLKNKPYMLLTTVLKNEASTFPATYRSAYYNSYGNWNANRFYFRIDSTGFNVTARLNVNFTSGGVPTPAPLTTNRKLFTSIWHAAVSDLFLYDNGSLVSSNLNFQSASNTDDIGSQLIEIGQLQFDRFFQGNIQEIIVYTYNVTANRTNIESNINSYYGVY